MTLSGAIFFGFNLEMIAAQVKWLDREKVRDHLSKLGVLL